MLDRIEPSVDRADRPRRGQDATTSSRPTSRPSDGGQRRRAADRCSPRPPAVRRARRPVVRARAPDHAGRRRPGPAWCSPRSLPGRWPRGGYALFTARRRRRRRRRFAVFLWDDVQDDGAQSLVGGALGLDGFSLFVTIVICVAVFVLGAVPRRLPASRRASTVPEVYALMLMSAAGGVMMASANDLIVLFLGLETLSIALYVLAASQLRRIESQEAGIKYFVLGGFSSAFLLYGIALVYGATGSTNLARIVDVPGPERAARERAAAGRHRAAARRPRLQGRGRPVPHRGRPTSTRARRRRSPASWPRRPRWPRSPALLRVFVVGLRHLRDDWQPMIWVLAVLTAPRRARCSPSCRPTSSGCWPTRRSATPASSSSASRRPAAGPHGDNRGVPRALLPAGLRRAWWSARFGVVTLVGRAGDGDQSLDAYRGLGRARPGAGPRAHRVPAGPGRRAAHHRASSPSST